MYTHKFTPGDIVTVNSKTSKRRGESGKILYYCRGRMHDTICRVQFADGSQRNFFDTSLELATSNRQI